MVTQAKARVRAAEFYALQALTADRLELIDGEVVVAHAPNPKHQRVTGNTHLLLRVLEQTIGGKAFAAPLEVYLDEENIPQPDVIWVAAEGKCQVTEKNLVGAPDLLVEVFSPSTERYDRREKFNLYQRFGVREYWMIDADAAYVEVWLLVDLKFVRQGIYGPGEHFSSVVLSGQVIAVDALFAA